MRRLAPGCAATFRRRFSDRPECLCTVQVRRARVPALFRASQLDDEKPGTQLIQAGRLDPPDPNHLPAGGSFARCGTRSGRQPSGTRSVVRQQARDGVAAVSANDRAAGWSSDGVLYELPTFLRG